MVNSVSHTDKVVHHFSKPTWCISSFQCSLEGPEWPEFGLALTWPQAPWPGSVPLSQTKGHLCYRTQATIQNADQLQYSISHCWNPQKQSDTLNRPLPFSISFLMASSVRASWAGLALGNMLILLIVVSLHLTDKLPGRANKEWALAVWQWLSHIFLWASCVKAQTWSIWAAEE